MKVLVGICCGGTLEAQTVASLVSALAKLSNEGHEFSLSIQIGGDKPHAMNRLARETVEKGWDYLMSIDNDMVFPDNGIIRLIDADKDIVGANYAVRGNAHQGDPRTSVIKIGDKNGEPIATTDIPKDLAKVLALGNGFTLYKRKVFETIPAPWFENKEDKDGNWSTEDVNFHRLAQSEKYGFEVWVHPKIDMGHIGKYQYRN